MHHVALIARDVEETIRFYQDLLGFFDFPGHDHPESTETLGGVQHIAISVGDEEFTTARARLDDAGVEYVGPDRGVEDNVYFRDPNGAPIELYREDLGIFDGTRVLPG